MTQFIFGNILIDKSITIYAKRFVCTNNIKELTLGVDNVVLLIFLSLVITVSKIFEFIIFKWYDYFSVPDVDQSVFFS
ncbi:hypothetical protein D3C81_1350160 [compost metagenome]